MKQFIKGSGFHSPLPPNLYAGQGYQYFKKPVLNMPVFKFLRTTGSPLLVLTNQVLLINWLLFLEFQKI